MQHKRHAPVIAFGARAGARFIESRDLDGDGNGFGR